MSQFRDNPPPLPLESHEPYTPEPPVPHTGVPMWALVVVSLSAALICGIIGFGAGFVTGAAATVFDEIDLYTSLENVTLTVEAPATVETGEAFAVVVTVDNQSDRAHTINTIDLYDAYVAGVTLESASPAWTESVHEDNYTEYSFPHTIQPGESLTIKLNFVAGDTPGLFADDLEIWFSDADSYLYETLETTVK